MGEGNEQNASEKKIRSHGTGLAMQVSCVSIAEMCIRDRPMVVGNLFQQLYNMVDSMVVGRFVGEDALAAVGSSFPVVFLSVAIAAGLSMGCTVVISQFFGAGKILEMKITCLLYTSRCV